MTENVQKGKPGRPTKAEQAAKGLTPTELDQVMRLLKRNFGPSIARAIEISGNEEVALDKQFRMNLELAKLYVEWLKVQEAMRKSPEAAASDADNGPEIERTVFKLAG